MKQLITLTVVAFLINPLAFFAQAAGAVSEKDFSADYDAFIRRVMERFPEIPSVSIVVIKDDKPFFLRGFGMANKEAGNKADGNTLYYIGSTTKPFTAMTAALLDREGKIKLDDPVTKHTTGLTFKSAIPEKVTVRNLLTHTSGLRNSPLVFRTAFSGEIDKKDIDHVFADATTYDEQRFGKYAYDNLGYNIYSLLAQRTLNKKWQDLLQEKIFGPLKMRHTTAYVSKARAAKWAMAEPYLLNGDTSNVIRAPITKQDNNMQAAGGMMTTASDMGRWLRMNINGGKLDGKQVIPAEIIKAVHTGYTTNTRNEGAFTGAGEYGLGWQIGKYREEKVIYHHGGYPGWNTHSSFMPDKKIGVAVLINESTIGGRLADVLATYAYDMLLGREDRVAAYAALLDQLSEGHAKSKQNALNSFRSRANRTSQLTKPLADYVGSYTNDRMGTIHISIDQNTLRVKLGYLDVLSTPFIQKDVIRVEMLPGQGDTMSFALDATGQVESLTLGGMKFTRVR